MRENWEEMKGKLEKSGRKASENQEKSNRKQRERGRKAIEE